MSRPVSAFVVLVLCVSRSLAEQEAESASGLTKFLSVLSGVYSNQQETRSDQADGNNGKGINHSLIDVVFEPLDIPALYPAYSVYFVEKLDNVVIRAQILAVTEPEANVINIQPYDLSSSGVITSDGVDQSSLSNLNLADLTVRPECRVTFEEVVDAVYTGNWPSCLTQEKNQLSYTITLTCKSVSFASFKGLYPEKSSKVPYIVKKTKSLPLLPYMYNGVDNVPNPCEK